MAPNKNINRRKFIGKTTAGLAGISIVPRHVIAGSGEVPPSDKLTIANIGCGTEGIRQMSDHLKNPKIQVVSVCDVNKYSTDYLDWSPHSIRNTIRDTLNEPNWGQYITGIPGGRDLMQEFVDKYYSKNQTSGKYKGCTSYEDFRELLEKETDVDAIKIMTPDHLHATIAVAGMKAGKHVITHKPIANRMSEARLTIDMARKTNVNTHLLAWRGRPEYKLIRSWIEDGVIGDLTEIHNWSYRPVWKQWTKLPTETPPIPDGFNWDLWLGPVPDRPYHPNYTHNVFRGWFEFGGGSVADMGHYSLFPLFAEFGITKSPISAKAFGTTTREAQNNVFKWVENKVAFPASCMVKLKFPKQATLPPFDLYWYDGGMKPFPPKELEEDDQDIPNEGMMFVGTKGKILAGFRGEDPAIIPGSKMRAYAGNKTITDQAPQDDNIWIDPILNNEPCPGNFPKAETVTETINLAGVAIRSGEQLDYDAQNMKITNNEEANTDLYREYRKGWELTI